MRDSASLCKVFYPDQSQRLTALKLIELADGSLIVCRNTTTTLDKSHGDSRA